MTHPGPWPRLRPGRRGAVLGFAIVLLLHAAPALAAPGHARLDRLDREYTVHADLTWTETVTADTTVLTERGVRENERDSFTFYPETQTLDLIEAWVDQPDGTRLTAGPNARFTRPSEAAQSAPGFTSAETTTVLFPQVHVGSRTHSVWRLVQTRPALLGFNVNLIVPPDMPVTEASVAISVPDSVPLHWAQRGGFAVQDHSAAGLRTISARIEATDAAEPERNMVDEADFAPLFLATSLPDLSEIGAIYFRQSEPKAVPTPEIAALAARVAQGRTGLEAARAVYDWVAGNIRYVAIYLDPNDGWVPHPAAEVLHNGYGDCKDHVVLTQAMLTSLGIVSEAALIEQGGRTRDLPLWVPQFNHVVVYLPQYNRFANPTNPYARLESLDQMLAGRTVVLADAHGTVARTPPALPQDNVYTIDSRLTLDADGRIGGTAEILPSANLESAARAAVAQAQSPRELAERLLANAPEGGFGQFETGDPRDLSQPFRMAAIWHSPHAVRFEDGEAFAAVPTGLDLDPATHLRGLLTDSGTRHYAMLTAARDDRWTMTLALPQGVTARRLPRNVAFANAAGSYTAAYSADADGVHSSRRLIVARPQYAADEYPDLQALIYAALDDARAVMVLGKTPTD